MQYFAYLLLYPILYIISILPFRILYFFSDCVCFFVYRIIGYRKSTVRQNLDLALPHLSNEERREIEKKFYKHLCDMFLEMIKTMSISVKDIESRFVFKNLEVYQDLESKNKSIAIMIAHYASYEWVVSLNSKINYKGYAIYKKIENKYFDQLIHKIRSKFNAYLIKSYKAIDIIEENHKNNLLSVYGFASDQTPLLTKAFYWRPFMGIEVPVHTGAEMLSKKYDMNIMFLKVKKIKRGYYEAELEVLSDNASSIPNYQITDMFTDRVEKQIYEAPEFYLWTHKRWKHRGKKPTN